MGTWEYDRKDFTAKLKLLKAALPRAGAANVAPAFTNLWFTGTGMTAANDTIALHADLGEAPTVGVRGMDLINLLATASGDKVQLSSDGNSHLKIKAGFRASLVLAGLGQPFKWQPPRGEEIVIDAPGIAALKIMRDVINPNADHRQATGVTVIRDASGTALYGTDRNAQVRCTLNQPGADSLSILNLPFAMQMMKLGEGRITIGEGFSQYVVGPIGLWGRHVIPELEGIEYGPMTERRPPSLEPVPKDFWPAVERAGVLAGMEVHAQPVALSVKNNRLTLQSSGPGGDVISKMDFPYHDLTLRFNQPLVERLAKHDITRVGLTPKTMLFSDDSGCVEYLLPTHETAPA